MQDIVGVCQAKVLTDTVAVEVDSSRECCSRIIYYYYYHFIHRAIAKNEASIITIVRRAV